MRLTLDAVTHGYAADVVLLDGVSLEVRRGESIAVVGPSGSGKTTFLSVAGGLLRPRAGTVRVTEDDGVTRSVEPLTSWVLQTVNVLPDRTVLDNVALGAFGDGRARAEAVAAVGPALAAVGLAGYETRKVRRLSGGEVQRWVIARALVSERPVVLADEPTGQLDQATSAVVVEALLAATVDKVLVVVTHDPAVAARCDRTYRLSAGRLELA